MTTFIVNDATTVSMFLMIRLDTYLVVVCFQVHLPPFSLCFDHPNNAVVLSIRGSMSLRVSV